MVRRLESGRGLESRKAQSTGRGGFINKYKKGVKALPT